MRHNKLLTPSGSKGAWGATYPNAYPRQRRPKIHVNYEPEYDLLFAHVGRNQAALSVEVDGVCIRIAHDAVVGVEIVDCASTFGLKPEDVNEAFVRRVLEKYGSKAVTGLRKAAEAPDDER